MVSELNYLLWPLLRSLGYRQSGVLNTRLNKSFLDCSGQQPLLGIPETQEQAGRNTVSLPGKSGKSAGASHKSQPVWAPPTPMSNGSPQSSPVSRDP